MSRRAAAGSGQLPRVAVLGKKLHGRFLHQGRGLGTHARTAAWQLCRCCKKLCAIRTVCCCESALLHNYLLCLGTTALLGCFASEPLDCAFLSFLLLRLRCCMRDCDRDMRDMRDCEQRPELPGHRGRQHCMSKVRQQRQPWKSATQLISNIAGGLYYCGLHCVVLPMAP